MEKTIPIMKITIKHYDENDNLINKTVKIIEEINNEKMDVDYLRLP